jgi:hypothetical protein
MMLVCLGQTCMKAIVHRVACTRGTYMQEIWCLIVAFPYRADRREHLMKKTLSRFVALVLVRFVRCYLGRVCQYA